MPAHVHPLPYDTPLGPGQVRAHRPDAATLVVLIGPPPLAHQLLALLPLAIPLTVFSIGLGVLLWSIFLRPGAIPMSRLLLLPIFLVWAVLAAELALSFRNWSAASRVVASAGVLAVPYPTPRSRPEELPAGRIDRLAVVADRPWPLRRPRYALLLQLHDGPAVRLLRGYPKATLDELSDLLGPEIGLRAAASEDSPRRH